MPFGSCSNCGTAWDPGESWHDDRIGDDCPGCLVVGQRRTIQDLNEKLDAIRTAVEESGEPCPVCGWAGSHDMKFIDMVLDGDRASCPLAVDE